MAGAQAARLSAAGAENNPMKIKLLAAGGARLVRAACAAPTTYHPAENDRSPGYSDERLADNRIRVTFVGNSVTPRRTVENYLLLRSAEVTHQAGYDWFVFDTRDTKTDTKYYTSFSGWPGWGPWHGFYRHNWRYGFGAFDDDLAMPVTRYEAYAEIVLLTPEQARHEPRALQASDVAARLGAKAETPAAAR
jgi:hypothetical protein